jgi:hypothetical protein
MKKKLVLRVKRPLNKNIVAITHAASCYIDDDFFTSKMHEIPEDHPNDKFQNYPVKVKAINIKWLF